MLLHVYLNASINLDNEETVNSQLIDDAFVDKDDNFHINLHIFYLIIKDKCNNFIVVKKLVNILNK